MRFNKWCVAVIWLSILGIPALSHAFDIELTPEKVNEAIEYGKKHRGPEIFDSNNVKAACFGGYPKDEGGVIMSKYIEIAIVSAMKIAKDKSIFPADVKDIVDSTTFNVIVDIAKKIETPTDVQIMLKQGDNNILPLKTEFGTPKSEFGMRYKDTRQSVIGVFEYSKVDPKASTTILVKFKNILEKYKISFVHVK